jgi:N-acetyl sugar amidotransferase
MKTPRYGLSEEVLFCSKCTITNQRPSSVVEFKHQEKDKKPTINFDENNICSACKFHEEEKNKNIDWNERENNLIQLLNKFKRNDGGYDVLVPGSGGKDSAFTSHILKYKYGMNPLTITWSPHLYTDIGWENFENWMHEGGLDNILFTPNGKLHRLLTKLSFHNLLHPFQPFIIGQRIIGPKFASKLGIKLVMYGENQAEYGNAIEENKNALMNMNFFSTQDPLSMKFGGVEMRDIIKDYNFSQGDFSSYIPPTMDELINKGVEVHYLGHYLKWDPQECYYYATEHTGFRSNTERTQGSYSKYSSIDDKIDPFHYYTTLIKFGIGRATYDSCQEIRNNKITREEGVHLVKKYDQEFPEKYFKEFLDYIDTSEEQFWDTINSFRSEHLWEKNEGKWKLKKIIK